MPYYLIQASYTHETWASLVHNPENRLEAVRPVVEKLGGSIREAWFAFGDYDFVALLDLPNNVNAAAFSHAVLATGMVREAKVTPLMTWEEGMESLRKARELGYPTIGPSA